MIKAKLYILTGLPYAGKTTLTNELVNRFGFSVVSVDEFIDEKGFEVEQMSQDDWGLVYSKTYERLKKYLTDGKTVILDIGNLKRSERETARRIAESMGVEHKLIYVNTPIEEVKKRREANQQTQERGHLEDATINRALSMFEEPTPDEKPTFYNQPVNLDSWIKENIAHKVLG